MLSNHLSHPNRYSKGEPLYNYLTLDFKQDVSTFGRFRSNKLYKSHQKQPNIFFKTFYKKQSRITQRKKQPLSSNRRQTSMTNRNTLVPTPLSSKQSNNPEDLNSIYPSLDIQRYKYLVKAISSISKTRKLPQFRQQISVKKEQGKSRGNDQALVGSPLQNKQRKRTKEVKLQIGFKTHRSPISKGSSQNVFQKLFKNKQLLLRGRYSPPHSPCRPQQTENFSFNFLGEEDLRIIQMSKQPRRPKPNNPL